MRLCLICPWCNYRMPATVLRRFSIIWQCCPRCERAVRWEIVPDKLIGTLQP